MIRFAHLIFRPADVLCANIVMTGLSGFALVITICSGGASVEQRVTFKDYDAAKTALEQLKNIVNGDEEELP